MKLEDINYMDTPDDNGFTKATFKLMQLSLYLCILRFKY